MKTLWMAGLVALFACTLVAPEAGLAQEEDDGDDPIWYVSAYNIPWAKVDSLTSLLEADQELVDEQVRRGQVLEGKVLIHHTADEYNVIFMTKYPSWDAVDDDPGLAAIAEDLGWSEEQRTARQEGFAHIFEGANAHRDYIYTEALSTGGM